MWGLLTTIPVPCGARHGKETRCNSYRSTHRQPPCLRTDPIVTQLSVSTAVTLLHPSEFPLLQPPFSSPSTSSSMPTPSFPFTQEPHHKNNYSHLSKTAKPKVQSPQRRKRRLQQCLSAPGGLRTPNPLSHACRTSTSGHSRHCLPKAFPSISTRNVPFATPIITHLPPITASVAISIVFYHHNTLSLKKRSPPDFYCIQTRLQ